MTPSNRYRLSSISTEVNNDDHSNYEHLSANPQDSSSSSSLSYPLGFIPDQDHGGSYHWKLNKYYEEKNVSPCESCNHEIENKERKTGLKLTIKKRDYKRENQTDNGSSKWMSSKMRMTRKMMHTDQTVADIPQTSLMKIEDQKQQSSSQETDNNSSIDNFSNNSNITIRVCADCHTTKTPLWRSGPRGPKSLCNACGIRQRKARRAMAASAASTNGSIMMAETSRVKGKMLHKEKKSKTRCTPQFKRRRKLDTSRKKFCFEEFMMNLSNNLTLQQVFPQDEKEAAILLMSLSYGLVHG